MKMKHGMRPIKDTTLTLHPEGESEPWEIDTGQYCGRAEDSVGFYIRKAGCVLGSVLIWNFGRFCPANAFDARIGGAS